MQEARRSSSVFFLPLPHRHATGDLGMGTHASHLFPALAHQPTLPLEEARLLLVLYRISIPPPSRSSDTEMGLLQIGMLGPSRPSLPKLATWSQCDYAGASGITTTVSAQNQGIVVSVACALCRER